MIEPKCSRAEKSEFVLEGPISGYLRGVTEQWLLVAPDANPAMLEMFRDRDRTPLRNLVPWAGEFAGKYLTSAVQVLRVTGDPRLRIHLKQFAKEIVSLQAEDGYLGPWPEKFRMTNRTINLNSDGKEFMLTWDTWGHYHIMLGLLLWHETSGDGEALVCAERIANLLCDRCLGNKRPRLVDTESTEMNLAPVHSLCLLYKKTGKSQFLDMALQIVEEFSAVGPTGEPLAGDYLNGPLAGKEFFQISKPRWESLHPIMGLVELYYITGKNEYQEAFKSIWHSIRKYDRHNNGGFSSGEQAQGNPFHQGAIETCCTIAWIALTVEMLKLTGDSTVADEIELSTLNSIIGMHSHTGRWATYNTPMDGVRKSSCHEIHFQAREGSPELNCCSVNSPRGFGMISDWALMRDAEGLILNWYGPGTMRTELPSGTEVVLTQETDYPRENTVRISISPRKKENFVFKLRIPGWSKQTCVVVNGKSTDEVKPGGYLSLSREWSQGDTVEMTFDFSFHCWIGRQECAGRFSLYRGPILLTYDRRFNPVNDESIPAFDEQVVSTGHIIPWQGWIPPILLMEFTASDGRCVRLCDFGSAGEVGTSYYSWLPFKKDPPNLRQFFG